jgi:hypothetical protein
MDGDGGGRHEGGEGFGGYGAEAKGDPAVVGAVVGVVRLPRYVGGVATDVMEEGYDEVADRRRFADQR